MYSIKLKSKLAAILITLPLALACETEQSFSDPKPGDNNTPPAAGGDSGSAPEAVSPPVVEETLPDSPGQVIIANKKNNRDQRRDSEGYTEVGVWQESSLTGHNGSLFEGQKFDFLVEAIEYCMGKSKALLGSRKSQEFFGTQ